MWPPAGSHSCVEGDPHLSESAEEPAVCRASPLDLAETTRDRLLVLDPDLTVRFADRSFGDAFIVNPEDTPCEKEGWQ